MKPWLTAHRLIEWTGERCVPWADDPQVIYEHLHRYLFACELATDRDIIDLGSGEGYGAAMLASRARSVLGVELDPTSVEHSRLHYPMPNLNFRCGSVLELADLPEASFDVVVCFEMIQYIAEQDELLAMASRLLAPSGVFLVSSTDRDVSGGSPGYGDPYQVKELNRSEFTDLLDAHFAHVRMWTQSAFVRSLLETLEPGSPGGILQDFAVRRIGDHWERTDPERPPHLVAAASNAPLEAVPDLSTLSRREPPPDEFGELQEAYELWDIESLRRQVAIFETALTAEIATRQRLSAEVERLTESLEEAQRAVDELTEIKGSKSWKALSEYRKLRDLARKHL